MDILGWLQMTMFFFIIVYFFGKMLEGKDDKNDKDD